MTQRRKPYQVYTKEFKQEAARLMESSNRPPAEIAMELGIRRNQLYKWKEQLNTQGNQAFKGRGRPKKEDQSELTTLQQENNRLREEIEILKKGRSILCARAEVKYAFIKAESGRHRVNRLLSVLEVSSSGYYDWLSRPESTRAIKDNRLLEKINLSHKASRYIYGSPRIHQDLIACGEQVGRKRVTHLMQKHGIQSKMARQFVITTNSKNTLSPAPDYLQREFSVSERDKAWVTDTTLIATRQGWLFLAVVLDLFSRKVIGWAMSDKNNSLLIQDALTMAVWRRGKVKDVIVHSDRGSTYVSSMYREPLLNHQLICSMSRKGECLDNAVAESFFGTLKTGWTDGKDYKIKADARQSIFEYIEVFYNRQPRHSYLGYPSPEEYERRNASQ